MNKKNAKELIGKYKAGQETPEDLALIEEWIMLGKVRDLDLSDEEIQIELNQIRNGLPLHYKAQKLNLWPRRIAAIAAAVTVITMTLWLYYPVSPAGESPGAYHYANDVEPGKNKATITLANGKTIALNDTKTGLIIGASSLMYNDGSAVLTPSSQEGETKQSAQTISTPRGGTYQITLSDGTKVWLNADSRLTYATVLNAGGERKVVLQGEAYFEVAKDKKHPFIVSSDQQEVRVLGTHFNINSYADGGGTKTTLLEGSVRVSGTGGRKILKPGYEAVNTGANIEIHKVDTQAAIAWKNGEFIFDNESLHSIMQKIARWYDVDIVYESGVNTAQTFGGKVLRNKPISAVLRSMQSTGKVVFKIEGKNVTVGK
ncbi:transmembrane sensor [Pedobacter africanus]|uniref:Uncharacterized protein n=1 Tax=Pedobacter africanus TaxID=151894 RepID=A0ACC6KVR9_9SPHI|nr:FecR domain-containing protein [Pedobacter africanus]MDR6783275.1 hypothetical protein [Pedobacter africanus]